MMNKIEKAKNLFKLGIPETDLLALELVEDWAFSEDRKENSGWDVYRYQNNNSYYEGNDHLIAHIEYTNGLGNRASYILMFRGVVNNVRYDEKERMSGLWWIGLAFEVWGVSKDWNEYIRFWDAVKRLDCYKEFKDMFEYIERNGMRV